MSAPCGAVRSPPAMRAVPSFCAAVPGQLAERSAAAEPLRGGFFGSCASLFLRGEFDLLLMRADLSLPYQADEQPPQLGIKLGPEIPFNFLQRLLHAHRVL